MALSIVILNFRQLTRRLLISASAFFRGFSFLQDPLKVNNLIFSLQKLIKKFEK
jgi:hypothetical protein